MGTTPTYGLRFPEPADPADVPTDMHELATDVETALGGKAPNARGIPAGGVFPQVLGKNSATDYDVGWLGETTFVNVTPAAGWVNLGSPYPPCRCILLSSLLVVVQGMMQAQGFPAANAVIATLPATHRPAATLTFVCQAATSTSRVEVASDGTIRWVSGASGGDPTNFLSLNGIIFPRFT